MKWAQGILVVALALVVSALVFSSGDVQAGGKDKAAKDYAKALENSVSGLMKFIGRHGDSDQADEARGVVAAIFTNYAPEDWFKKNIKVAKVLLADLEERNPRGAKRLKGKILDVELVGNAPPAIEVTALDGKPLSLEDYKGKVLLIDFWATWCGPCIGELPNLKEVYAKYKDKGFDILGISLDREGTRENLESFIETEEMAWRHFFDREGGKNEISDLYGISSIPKTYLLGKDGKVVKVGLRGEALGKAVAELIK